MSLMLLEGRTVKDGPTDSIPFFIVRHLLTPETDEKLGRTFTFYALYLGILHYRYLAIVVKASPLLMHTELCSMDAKF